MPKPLHAVAETNPYLDDCNYAGVSEAERAKIVDYIACNPTAGDVIKGTGGARKVRIAREGGGKRGGFRLISAFVGESAPVYLFALYAKNDRENISAKEANALKTVIAAIKKHWKPEKKT